MATHGGAADSYYNDAPQSQPQYPMQSYGNGNQYNQNGAQKFQQPPPGYGPGPPPPMDGGKQSFDQAFKLDKPKYNDLWAGILVRKHP